MDFNFKFDHQQEIHSIMSYMGCTEEEAIDCVVRYQGHEPGVIYLTGWLDGRHQSIEELNKRYSEISEVAYKAIRDRDRPGSD